ncbi:hypothetical protein T440DRAFT_478175 [Plenodomus tracheiphilus IPT5]|uniref:Uncharacterized protein n=1 Tax=Plenodomus tracheiphilus IPT5 TaxID=1408161 RepID=A0A6A7BBY0_9PLEO|nr:hypothetical protein T440DRAFT_478175 [Plenodomus tracheiphilus IPT5]
MVIQLPWVVATKRSSNSYANRGFSDDPRGMSSGRGGMSGGMMGGRDGYGGVPGGYGGFSGGHSMPSGHGGISGFCGVVGVACQAGCQNTTVVQEATNAAADMTLKATTRDSSVLLDVQDDKEVINDKDCRVSVHKGTRGVVGWVEWKKPVK